MDTVEEKRLIMKEKSKLKDVLNEDGEPYYINDNIDPKTTETRTRYRQIVQANKRNTANQVEMSFFKGGLKIQNQVYKNKVRVPQPADFLNLSMEEFDAVMAIKTPQGRRIVEGKNVMLGFSTPAQTHAEINRAYIKLKLKFPQAASITCSYQIPGIEKYYCSDYCDDGEYGAARKILEQMVKSKITSRAIFVVRYSDGSKLGPRRFPMYIEAATSAIEATPYNPLTLKEQRMMAYSTKSQYEQTERKIAQTSGRGKRIYAPPRITRKEPQSNEEYEQIPNFRFNPPWNKVGGATMDEEPNTGEWSQLDTRKEQDQDENWETNSIPEQG